MMKKLLISICTLFALMNVSSSAMAEEAGLWAKTRAGANAVMAWTAEKSQQGWHAAKKGASRLAVWTGEKSRNAWKATKKGAQQAAAWTVKKSKQGWQTTKQSVSSAARHHGSQSGKERRSRHHPDHQRRHPTRSVAV